MKKIEYIKIGASLILLLSLNGCGSGATSAIAGMASNYSADLLEDIDFKKIETGGTCSDVSGTFNIAGAATTMTCTNGKDTETTAVESSTEVDTITQTGCSFFDNTGDGGIVLSNVAKYSPIVTRGVDYTATENTTFSVTDSSLVGSSTLNIKYENGVTCSASRTITGIKL